MTNVDVMAMLPHALPFVSSVALCVNGSAQDGSTRHRMMLNCQQHLDFDLPEPWLSRRALCSQVCRNGIKSVTIS